MSSQAEQLLQLLEKEFSALDKTLLDIVLNAKSVNAADKTAEDNDYPLTVVKEARRLAIIKQQQPGVFAELMPRLVGRLSNNQTQGIFPCYWSVGVRHGQDEEPANPGTVNVSKHDILPPLFWGYEVCKESGQLLFSSDPNIELERLVPDPWGDGVADNVNCLLTSSSKSLPVGLYLNCERHLYDGQSGLIAFSRKSGNEEICWHRIIPKENKQKELFAVFMNRHNRISGTAIHLRPLTKNETVFLSKTGLEDYWGLFISSTFRYPLNGRACLFEVTTCYTLHSPWLQKETDSFFAFKVEEFSFSKASWYTFDAYRGKGVFVRFQLFDSELSDSYQYESKPLEERIEERIEEIISGSPDILNCKEVFWKLFGFKRDRSQIGIYGESGALGYKAPKQK